MQDRFQLMLEMQLELQKKHMKDGDPRYLEGNDMATFMTWNAFAMDDEVHEAMAEIGWKPWATSRHINQEAFLREMVDAYHFFMNMLLCGCQGWSPEQIADEFTRRYIAKNAINAQRQEEGYDAVASKCGWCKRELSELQEAAKAYIYSGETGMRFCNREHHDLEQNVLTDARAQEGQHG